MINYLLLAIFGYFFGFFSRDIYNLLVFIKMHLPAPAEAPEPQPEAKQNSFAEPMTALEMAAQTERQRIKDLNPDV